MHDWDDNALLREYNERGSEEAFATLVTRHVHKVYSVALRQAGNAHAAEEITQVVFVILARKSRHLGRRVILSGWLYQTARLTAVTFVRSEIRRARREQEAQMQTVLNDPESDPWPQIAPLLEAAMAHLNEADRHAVVLRFFDGKSLKAVGATLGASEDTARQRVNRAVEKLRRFFAKRGVLLPAAALTAAIAANSVQAAPAALANTVTTVALAKGAAASGSTLTLIKGALKLMAWTKAKMAAVVATSLILTTSVSVVVVQRASLVQGKTESEWIKSIVYHGDDNQRHLWQSLGPRGVHMLIRALQTPGGPGNGLKDTNRFTHMNAADLLCELENYNGEKGYHADKSAIPELIKLLKTEKDDSVRGLELACFEIPIQSMPEKQKAELWPELLRALQSPDANVRNNALAPLQYYPKQTETVVPLLVQALQDSAPYVRLHAAEELNTVDPETAGKSDVVRVLVGCLRDPQTANDATFALGALHNEPNLVVPALVQSLQSAASYVRGNSAAALGRFGGQAKSAVPALQKALEDSDAYVRREAAAALKRINSGAPAQ